MITHKSLKLIIDENNKEAQRLRNDLHNALLRVDHLQREHDAVFMELFGRPVACITIKEVGRKVEVRTKSGETLLFEINIIGARNGIFNEGDAAE